MEDVEKGWELLWNHWIYFLHNYLQYGAFQLWNREAPRFRAYTNHRTRQADTCFQASRLRIHPSLTGMWLKWSCRTFLVRHGTVRKRTSTISTGFNGQPDGRLQGAFWYDIHSRKRQYNHSKISADDRSGKESYPMAEVLYGIHHRSTYSLRAVCCVQNSCNFKQEVIWL